MSKKIGSICLDCNIDISDRLQAIRKLDICVCDDYTSQLVLIFLRLSPDVVDLVTFYFDEQQWIVATYIQHLKNTGALKQDAEIIVYLAEGVSGHNLGNSTALHCLFATVATAHPNREVMVLLPRDNRGGRNIYESTFFFNTIVGLHPGDQIITCATPHICFSALAAMTDELRARYEAISSVATNKKAGKSIAVSEDSIKLQALVNESHKRYYNILIGNVPNDIRLAMDRGTELLSKYGTQLNDFYLKVKDAQIRHFASLNDKLSNVIKAAHDLLGECLDKLDDERIAVIRSSDGTSKAYSANNQIDQIGKSQMAMCLAANEVLENGVPSIIFQEIDTDRTNLNNHATLLTIAAILCGKAKSLISSSTVRLSGIEWIVELIKAACDNNGITLIMAAEIGMEITEVMAAEVHRVKQRKIALEVYHDKIQKLVNTMSDKQVEEFTMMKLASTIIHGILSKRGKFMSSTQA